MDYVSLIFFLWRASDLLPGIPLTWYLYACNELSCWSTFRYFLMNFRCEKRRINLVTWLENDFVRLLAEGEVSFVWFPNFTSIYFEISQKLHDFHFTNVSCSCTHGIHVYSACWTCCFEVILNGFQSREWHGEGKDHFFSWKSAVFLVLLERLMNYHFGMSIFQCRSR